MTQATGFIMTMAHGSFDRSLASQIRQKRQQRQAENGEIVPLDALEQLDALALDLIGADAAERAFADARRDSGRFRPASAGRMVSARCRRWRQATTPPLATATAEWRRWVRPASRASWPRASSRDVGLVPAIPSHSSVWSAPTVSASGWRRLTPARLGLGERGGDLDRRSHRARSAAPRPRARRSPPARLEGDAGVASSAVRVGLPEARTMRVIATSSASCASRLLAEHHDRRRRLLDRAAGDVDDRPAVARAELAGEGDLVGDRRLVDIGEIGGRH